MISDGIKKSAILLILLGAKQAVEILKNLEELEINNIITFMVTISTISQKEIYDVLNQCMTDYYNISDSILFHDDTYISSVIFQVLEKKSADILLQKASNNRSFINKISQLNCMRAKDIADLIHEEHPNIITTILFFLNRTLSANIILNFKDYQRCEIVYLISNFKGIEESRFSELMKVIDMLLSKKNFFLFRRKSLMVAIEIIHAMHIKDEYAILNKIYKFDKYIAEQMMYEMFTFKDIIRLTDKSMCIIMQKIDRDKIILAMHNIDKKLKLKFLTNMPKLESDQIVLELSRKCFISHNMVIDAQNFIVKTIKRLLRTKHIFLSSLDTFYV